MKSLKLVSLALASSLQITACGPQDQSGSQLNEAWNEKNNPAIMSGDDFVAKFKDLPLAGEIQGKGWSDDYWPTYRGGISYRWKKKDFGYEVAKKDTLKNLDINSLSPAEKYDIFMNRFDFPTVQKERQRTSVLKTLSGHPEFEEGYKIESWEGLCHGWAPAALNFKEPSKTVKVNSQAGAIEFYSSDVKALLTYYQQYSGNRSTRTSFVAARCNLDFAKLDQQYNSGEITQAEWIDGRENSACADINAGAFHLILANEIAIKKQGFVVDITRDAQVWNQPVNSFSSKVTATKQGASEGAAPGTVKELTIDTWMLYTVEIRDPSATPVGAIESPASYSYVLELNDKDEVIGGRWLSDLRPDFAWRETTPKFRGYFAGLKYLHEQSISTSR